MVHDLQSVQAVGGGDVVMAVREPFTTAQHAHAEASLLRLLGWATFVTPTDFARSRHGLLRLGAELAAEPARAGLSADDVAFVHARRPSVAGVPRAPVASAFALDLEVEAEELSAGSGDDLEAEVTGELHACARAERRALERSVAALLDDDGDGDGELAGAEDGAEAEEAALWVTSASRAFWGGADDATGRPPLGCGGGTSVYDDDELDLESGGGAAAHAPSPPAYRQVRMPGARAPGGLPQHARPLPDARSTWCQSAWALEAMGGQGMEV
eukprot:Transcript_17482.p2 GENE.Transcript_17482~~Transcript_17482.p2  ORF type:complete len:271 (-),score=105.34 Transcript_17482:88-900(-)